MMVGMDVPLIIAGVLALTAAAAHGAGGEVLVVRKLSPATLPPTRFGGPRMTLKMIQASWHLATVGFLTVAAALLLAGTALDGDAARDVALVAAGGATGFAAVTILASGSLATLRRHPAAALLSAVAALAWWGGLSF
jgi:hypothetical protein